MKVLLICCLTLGFAEAEVTNLNAVCSSGYQSTTDRFGGINSGNYPDAYPTKVNCGFNITMNDITKIVKLTIVDLDLEEADPCKDYLQIFDGDTEFDDPLGNFCGTLDLPKILYSTGNKMFIKFYSDKTENTGRGFYVVFEESSPPPSSTTASTASEPPHTTTNDPTHTTTNEPTHTTTNEPPSSTSEGTTQSPTTPSQTCKFSCNFEADSVCNASSIYANPLIAEKWTDNSDVPKPETGDWYAVGRISTIAFFDLAYDYECTNGTVSYKYFLNIVDGSALGVSDGNDVIKYYQGPVKATEWKSDKADIGGKKQIDFMAAGSAKDVFAIDDICITCTN